MVIVLCFGLFCIVLPIVVYIADTGSELVSHLLTVFISWPVAAVVIALLVLKRFGASLEAYLRNVAIMKLPGGIELQRQAATGNVASAHGPEGSITLSKDQQEELRQFLQLGWQEAEEQTAQREALEERWKEATVDVLKWKFHYLQSIYVPRTKQVLQWFAQSRVDSNDHFHSLWAPFIPDAKERGTILDVLLDYGMLKHDKTGITISLEGYTFLQFTGSIPTPPPTTPGADSKSV